ncbi:MAG: hypothetical protein RMY29_020110 [Nostoc sp. CreGUA01]
MGRWGDGGKRINTSPPPHTSHTPSSPPSPSPPHPPTPPTPPTPLTPNSPCPMPHAPNPNHIFYELLLFVN